MKPTNVTSLLNRSAVWKFTLAEATRIFKHLKVFVVESLKTVWTFQSWVRTGRNAHLCSKLITLHYHQPHSRRWSMTVSGKEAQMVENPLTSVLPLSAVVKQRASQSVPVMKTSGASWGLQEKRKKMLLKIHAKTVRQRCTSMSVVQKNRVFVLTAVMSWEPVWTELVLYLFFIKPVQQHRCFIALVINDVKPLQHCCCFIALVF